MFFPINRHHTAAFYNFSIIVAFLMSVFTSHFPPQNDVQKASLLFPLFLWSLILVSGEIRLRLFIFIESLISRKVITGIFISICFCGFSLAISENQEYGIKKIWGILFGLIPVIFAFVLILKTLTPERWKNFVILTVLFGVLLTGALYFSDLFESTESDKVLLWSHVGTGRFLGFSFLASIYWFHKSKSFIFFVITSFLFSGIVLSGLRAVVIILSPVFVFFLFSVFRDSKIPSKGKYYITIILISLLVIVLINFVLSPELMNRFSNLLTLNIYGDASFNGRFLGLTNAFLMILERPILGWGVGGFDIPYGKFDQSIFLHYPHNIFVEVAVEYGIIACCIFIYLLVKMFKQIHSAHQYLTLLFSYALWISCFSGDITYQKPLLIGVAFVFLNDQEKELVKNLI